MTKHNCKYCQREMKVSSLEFKSNSYCNACFEDRAKKAVTNSNKKVMFTFNGISIPYN
jgi:hypothetical protein